MPIRLHLIALLVTSVPLLGCALRPALTPSPEDWRDVVIYQVLTDRYWDGDPTNNEANPTGNRGVVGGDFAGLMQRLDHIEALGFNAIWISPVSFNVRGAYHGYHAMAWDQIDPHWGTEEQLRSLVDECHRRDIRVFFDIICNHMGDLIEGEEEGYPEYLAPPGEYTPTWSGDLRYPPPFDDLSMFQTHGRPEDWDSEEAIFGEIYHLDDLRTTDHRVREYLVDLWVDMAIRFDIDGFRIDTVKHVEMDFWEEWAPEVERRLARRGKRDFLMFGEVWKGAVADLAPYTGPLDSVTDFPRYYRTLDVFAKGTAGPVSLEDHWSALSEQMDPETRDRLVTFIDNHDVDRFLLEAQRAVSPEFELAPERLHAALVYHLTAPGIPVVYYGTEIGFSGEGGFLGGGGRMPMWNENGTDLFDLENPTARLIADLNALRREHAALRRGELVFHHADAEPGLLVFSRILDGDEVLVGINTDPERSRGWRPGEGLERVMESQPRRRSALAPEGFISLEPFGWAVCVRR